MITWPELSPEAQHALADVSAGVLLVIKSLIIPAIFLYVTLYALVKQRTRLFEILTWSTVFAFLFSGWAVVVQCSALRSLQHFVGRCSTCGPRISN